MEAVAEVVAKVAAQANDTMSSGKNNDAKKVGVLLLLLSLSSYVSLFLYTHSWVCVCVCNLFPFPSLCVKTLCFLYLVFCVWICRESAAGEIEATVN